ncbi:hypothetical protein EYF80_004560 [Liparis tanakae]|uniref:Uncharacterized protein n=1 Tax=Liparis tanakae TaxID=230148 RepID=A0A4Z2J4V6_9TELE|nr:hypothetical protein EYF80_004560 [Liparis tanakae]
MVMDATVLAGRAENWMSWGWLRPEKLVGLAAVRCSKVKPQISHLPQGGDKDPYTSYEHSNYNTNRSNCGHSVHNSINNLYSIDSRITNTTKYSFNHNISNFSRSFTVWNIQIRDITNINFSINNN